MLERDAAHLSADLDDDEARLAAFVHLDNTPSGQFARQVTEVAFNGITDEASRRRAQHLVLPIVAADAKSVALQVEAAKGVYGVKTVVSPPTGVTAVTPPTGVATVTIPSGVTMATPPTEVAMATPPTEVATAWLRHAAHRHPATLIVGNHGLGKSSFVKRVMSRDMAVRPMTIIPLVKGLPEAEIELAAEAEPVVAPEEVQIKGEPEAGSFVATPELIGAWLAGLNAVREESNHEALPSINADTLERYSYELTRQIRKIISNFAKRKSYEGGRYRITFGQRFLPSVESIIEDHLMLPPRNAVAFLDIFKDELYRQTISGAVFYGRWGSLIVDDADELVLDLQKRRSRRLSSVLKG